jgi:hypothetical protein
MQFLFARRMMSLVRRLDAGNESSDRLDTEQEREQEQEQEKEVEARQTQLVETEVFIDREYSRLEEVQVSWPFTILSNCSSVGTVPDHPFYPLKNFQLRHQEPLYFDDNLYLSRNYFNPAWTGLRRLKNVVMVKQLFENDLHYTCLFLFEL